MTTRRTNSEHLLVDARQAAQLLAVSERTLWSMTFRSKPGIPHVRCGRLVRYSVDDLNSWIESRRIGGAV